MYMLDTDTCSYIIRERPISVYEKFKRIPADDICVSTVTQAELFYGVARSQSKKINLEIVDDFLSRLIILDWDSAAAQHYGVLRTKLEKKGRLIGNMDMMIAAHALSIHATVVTNNTKHFSEISALKIVNWV